jgi:hypothetical protein
MADNVEWKFPTANEENILELLYGIGKLMHILTYIRDYRWSTWLNTGGIARQGLEQLPTSNPKKFCSVVQTNGQA